MLRLLLSAALLLPAAAAPAADPPLVATFSILGLDPETGEIGVAVQSKFLAVGAVVPWAKAGVGAVATQAFANVSYGPRGLAMLEEGKSPAEVVAALIESDPAGNHRQVGVLSADGKGANFTGRGCFGWAGGFHGENFSVQGNILAGEEVLKAMAKSFLDSSGGDKPLAQRLIDALKAAQEAGGDRRGQQSAALLVVREGWGFNGGGDRFRDLRVDDHAAPIAELQRLYDLHRKRSPRPNKEEPAKDAKGREGDGEKDSVTEGR